MLTELTIKALKPRDKLYRVADREGLCLEVTPTGSKLWRYRYRYAGKARMMALGKWDEITLLDARDRLRDARRLLANGMDPMASKRAATAAQVKEGRVAFPAFAAEWLEYKRKRVGIETYRKARLVTEGDLIPSLRRHSIDTLATKDVTPVLDKIAQRAPNLAVKARQYLGGMVAYAIQQGLREDGKLLSLRGTLVKYDAGHIPAITKPAELRPLLLAIDGYSQQVTRTALLLASLTALRPSVIASAQWAHIDLEAGEWHIPGHLMKTRHDHIVPLPRQAVTLLEAIRGNDPGQYVFPSPAKQKTPHLHRDALSKALREMGFQGKHATHGFRGTLRTMARERLSVDIDVLEAQLAHAKKGDVQKAYDRTTFDDQRREVMQAWADYLDNLRKDPAGKVVAIKRKASG
ncbi:integrase arm-type DNA-binding domain-containing protein [Thermomonas brevis]|uniref:Integrase arm-type DNA-binding domain-containing protein n=1 Tax=Thermomonas brevis TaxID=215691 RepID=A0A7G9QV33_9GAMM|nr:site-specific integrase [Thermomonas brevis]QNN47208.1 integrase arm-type DNA-binding domain-containing protein [Thermomonas brevis]